jgi:hypothetical protein
MGGNRHTISMPIPNYFHAQLIAGMEDNQGVLFATLTNYRPVTENSVITYWQFLHGSCFAVLVFHRLFSCCGSIQCKYSEEA